MAFSGIPGETPVTLTETKQPGKAPEKRMVGKRSFPFWDKRPFFRGKIVVSFNRFLFEVIHHSEILQQKLGVDSSKPAAVAEAYVVSERRLFRVVAAQEVENEDEA